MAKKPTSRHMSKPVYMDKKPAHFVTRLANPYTRFGDPQYAQCTNEWCNKLCSPLGYTSHKRWCDKRNPRNIR